MQTETRVSSCITNIWNKSLKKKGEKADLKLKAKGTVHKYFTLADKIVFTDIWIKNSDTAVHILELIKQMVLPFGEKIS